MKSQEREQIKTLNNKFASFIDKVSRRGHCFWDEMLCLCWIKRQCWTISGVIDVTAKARGLGEFQMGEMLILWTTHSTTFSLHSIFQSKCTLFIENFDIIEKLK